MFVKYLPSPRCRLRGPSDCKYGQSCIGVSKARVDILMSIDDMLEIDSVRNLLLQDWKNPTSNQQLNAISWSMAYSCGLAGSIMTPSLVLSSVTR